VPSHKEAMGSGWAVPCILNHGMMDVWWFAPCFGMLCLGKQLPATIGKEAGWP